MRRRTNCKLGVWWRLTGCVLALVGFRGCEPLCIARGRLLVAGAKPETRCTIRLGHPEGDPTIGVPCRSANGNRDDASSAVRPGEEFECRSMPSSPSEQVVAVASCPGYANQTSREFSWVVRGLQCQPVDLGSVAVSEVTTK